jgi:tetratricopeptide (TPR) repeat protein
MSEKKANRDATAKPRRERQRGRILTEAGWNKLDAALQAWEVEQDCKRTFERIAAETQLDPGTVAKIFKRKEGADLGKLEQLFGTFQLTLEAADHRLVPQGIIPIADPNFVGRAEAIADLNRLIDRGVKVIVIQARGGVGKTTLARKYLQQEFESILEFPIAKETKDIASIESLIEEKLRQLGEEPGREFFVSLDRLKRKLQAERIGILIDNLEPALDAAGKLIEPHRRYVELLRVLADPSVQAVTLITSRERLNEYSISVQHYLLEELSLEAWKQFFQHRFALFAGDRDVSDTDELALAALHKSYGGNAKAMDILCGAVLTDYSGNIKAYWQANQDDLLIERALEDLVVGQFDRLQQLDPDAYNLLCRMGCYRYQDVPTVPIEGLLCLLWDVPENRQRRVVKSLQERSLVEFENGEYWLHPVIRGEAIGRVRESKDWEMANCKAAELLSEIVEVVEDIDSALKALEPCYHYLAIENFLQASNVILKERNNKWVSRSDLKVNLISPLGSSLVRLGLIQQTIFLLSQLINHIEDEHYLDRLYITLGESYHVAGNIQESIELFECAHTLAVNLNHKENEINALFNIALCKEDILDTEKGMNLHEKIISLAENTVFHRYAVQSYHCLVYIYSRLNQQEKVREFLGKASGEITTIVLGIRNTGYRFCALGYGYSCLGETEKSFQMFDQAISYAEGTGFTQLKALSLIGLAVLHRIQSNYNLALCKCVEAIELLSLIGARRNLADAHYQLGLTYQAMGEIEKRNENFQEAIRLFNEMEAPKQVERVMQSMQSEN